MKILKVRVKREKTGGSTKSIYPTDCACRWMLHEGEIFEDGGNEYQYRIGFCKDDLATRLVKDYPDDYEEITKETAVQYAEQHQPTRDIIVDEGEVLDILKKVVASEALTKEEKGSIDSLKTTGAVRTKKDWDTKFTEAESDNNLISKVDG